VRRAAGGVAVWPETVLIPAGEFVMGDENGRPDERPAHIVHVDAFRVALTPVTNAQYRAFLASTGHTEPKFWSDARFNADDQPAVGITWDDGVAYCDWLSAATGARWRLPTESEREKAARGAGDADGPEDWPEQGRFAQDAPWAVGLSRPNGYGLFDMTYNVHEWCSDWYGAEYYRVSPRDNPRGPETGTRRASRGGAWRHQVKVNRVSARSSLPPSFEYNDYGFRVYCDGRGSP
jgi:formylglycine-generating enzyme required for sulfatase activity